MDQIKTPQSSSGECSQARHSICENTSSPTGESCQANEPTGSNHEQKFDVFLSHSGKQKIPARQLYRDLTNQGVSCFFDQDRESLPVAEDFPSRIFEASKTCKVAVLLLSKDFFQSKWPMLELSAFVEAKDITRTNPNLKILPVFFLISPDALKNITADNEKWKQLEKSCEKRAEWHQALNAIRRINGLTFREVGDVMEFSEQIVKEIWHILPAPSPRYHVPHMQGEVRMCQEVAHFFNRVQLNERGIRIAGLYGIAGQGKTTLGKAFCNYKLGDFEGKACHLEFSRSDPVERIKLALQYLTHRPQSYLQTLTIQDEAQNELYTRLRGQRAKGQKALLVLDNITEESIDEVTYYLRADFGENSCILLSSRSVDVLKKHFNVDSQSCMRVPRLEEEEAIAILVKRAFPGESKLGAEDRDFALKCANRCSFKETNGDIYPRARTFHPLALKAFGRYLLCKNGSNLSKWVAEIDGMVDGYGDGLVEVFSVLHKAFICMHPKYRTIFMLLAVYMLPNMTPGRVKEWLAINCNEEISFIEIAVENLCKKAFIEEFEPEIRIHDLYVEFAQSKANEMERWLWWKKKDDQCSRRGLIAQDNAGFELAKLQQCRYRTIAPDYLRNLLLLQLVNVHNLIKLDLGQMNKLRSITLQNCKALATLDGLPNLLDLAWLQIGGVNPMFRLPELSSIEGLQHLEIDIADSQVIDQLGDLTNCFCLREIKVRCPSLSEFPRLSGMPHLEKVEFSLCENVQGILNCTECMELQSVVLNRCCRMSSSPYLAGCEKLSKIVLSECDAVTACADMYVPSSLKTLELFISQEAASVPRDLESCYELENLQLWNMGELRKLPDFRRFSNLTVLKLGKCGISQPPNLTCCVMLENVYFFTLKNLESFPNFSLLRKLKILSLYNCRRVQDPPDISVCHQLQILHLLYNDNMKGLPKMDECAQLDEIKVSWHGEDEVTYDGIDPDSCEVDDDFQSCLEHFEEEIPVENLNDVFVPEELREWQRMQEQRWMQRRTILAKKYFRGVKLYYSITTPYEAYKSSKFYKPNYVTLRLINSKVLASPTLGRVSKDRDWLNKDRDWLKKVREYFAGKRVIVRTSAVSVRENVEAISFQLPPSPRYQVPAMQGEARMCQNVADFIKTLHPNGKGIRIAGLYGMAGQGKTTLAKAFCNHKWGDFDGKVCHLEFSRGNKLERLKLLLRCLIDCRESQLEWVTSEEEAHYLFNTLVEGQRVLLVLDNIMDADKEEVRYYLGAELGENSCIILTAQRIDALNRKRNFNIDSQSCMRVPSLIDEEAIAILLESTFPEESAFGVEQRHFALRCANRCSFTDDTGFAPTFHPLALKTFGRHLISKHRSDLSNFVPEIHRFEDGTRDGLDDVFSVLKKAFDDMDPKYRTIIMLLTVDELQKNSAEKVVQWLAIYCNNDINYITEAVKNLWKNGFIEETEHQIRIHELVDEIAQNKIKNAKPEDDETAISRLLPPPSPRYHVPTMQGEERMCQELADFFNSIHPNNKGIRIAGLDGMPGKGKSMLGMAFCNLSLGNFYGKVCHLDFCGGNTLERKKHALQYLTPCRKSQLESLTREHEVHCLFNTLVEGQRVLLVLDNITKDTMDEVREYLWAELGKKSCILLTAGSIDILKRQRSFNIELQSCMRVPRLKEEEAIAIFLEMTCLEKSGMVAQHRDFALKCANICSFKEEGDSSPTFHPLALKAFGRHLFSKKGSDWSKWHAEIDGLAERAGDGLNSLFAVLTKFFDDMDPKHRIIFMLLTRDLQPRLSFNEVLEWLAGKCNEDIKYIEEAIEDLCQNAFIEGIEPEIRIHDLFKEFAQIKAKQEETPGKEKLDEMSTVQGGRMLQDFLKIERQEIVCKKKKHALTGGGRLKTITKLPKLFLNQHNRRKIIKKQENYRWKIVKKPPKQKFRTKLFKHFWKGCGIGCAKLDRG